MSYKVHQDTVDYRENRGWSRAKFRKLAEVLDINRAQDPGPDENRAENPLQSRTHLNPPYSIDLRRPGASSPSIFRTLTAHKPDCRTVKPFFSRQPTHPGEMPFVPVPLAHVWTNS